MTTPLLIHVFKCFCTYFMSLNWINILFLLITHKGLHGYPPTYQHLFYFWMEYCLTFVLKLTVVGIYTTIKTRSRNTKAYKMYCLTILVISCCSVLTFLSGWQSPKIADMQRFSKDYFVLHNKRIPPYLDEFQLRYQCCGIADYRDYMSKGSMPIPFPPNTTIINEYPNEELFNVPPSCCTFITWLKNKDCGLGMTKSQLNRLNNATKGCFKTYNVITSLKHLRTSYQWFAYSIILFPLFKIISGLLLLVLFRRCFNLNATRVAPTHEIEYDHDHECEDKAEIVVPVDDIVLSTDPDDPLVKRQHSYIFVKPSPTRHGSEISVISEDVFVTESSQIIPGIRYNEDY